MLVSEIIYRYNSERPNEVEDSRKLAYIRQVEKYILNECVKTHEMDSRIDSIIRNRIDELNKYAETEEEYEVVNKALTESDFNKYFEYFDGNYELLADEPYDDMYIHYIDMKIASAQNEQKRYNAASTMYNNCYITFQDSYNRTHLPLSKPLNCVHHRLL